MTRPSVTETNARHNSELLLTAAQFQRAYERERSRSDRAEREFCLLAFTIDSGQDGVAKLSSLLEERLRITDDQGLMHDGRLGVILAETSAEKGRSLGTDLSQAMRDQGVEVVCDVYVYPSETNSDDDGSGPINRISEQTLDIPSLVTTDVAQPVVPLFTQPLPTWKRGLDIIGATIGLLLFSPVILVAGLIVKLTSRGPVFFVQKRSGLGGQPFMMYKLRTMAAGAEKKVDELRQFSEQDGPAFKLTNDPRVTPIGHILRKTSIDELPQLINVLLGDMTLVGPRPLPCVEQDGCAMWQQRRLEVTPGITCIWQIEGRSRVSFTEWIRMDIRYIRKKSCKLDLSLLWKTIPAVLLRRGAK